MATRPEGGAATPMPARQFQISDPQVRPDQRGITVVTEGTVTQPDILMYGTEALGDGSSPYSSPFMIQSGPDGSLYMVSPEQTAGSAQDTTAPPPAGKTLDEGATAPKEQPLLDIDAEFARMAAEFAATAEKPDAGDPVAAPDARKQAVDVTPQASDASNPLVSPSSPKQEATPSAASAHPAADAGNPVAETNSPRPVPDTGPSPTRPGTATTSPGTPAVPSKPGTPSSTDSGPGASNSVAHPPPSAGNPKPPGDTVGEPSAQATAGRTPSGASSLNAIPYAAPAALLGYTPDGAAAQTSSPTPPAGSPTDNLGGTPQPAATPPAPIAATGRPGTDEPDADPEEFPTPPGTIVDDPREHNVQKDPREHSVWEDPRDHSVQKKPAGDYVTVPGVSYPLEDEPPADAIPVIPRTPALTPLPVDSVGLGRAFQNPDNPDSASPRPPDITNPLSDRHVAAPETGLDAGLDKPPAAPAVPSRYATEPNPETPGAPQKPASPQLNPHSLEYQQDPSRLPAVGGVPHLQPAPQPSGKAERKRLIAQMGTGDKPRRRKKQPPPEPEPTPPPTPDLPVPTPTPPKPRKHGRTTPPHGATDAHHDLNHDAASGSAARNNATTTHVPGDVPRWAMGFNRDPDTGEEWSQAAVPPASGTQQPQEITDVAAQRARELAQQLRDTVMDDWPVQDHAAAAETMITALLRSAEGPALVRVTNGGEGRARWVSVEVTDQSRETPARDDPAGAPTDSGRAIDSVERAAGAWGFALRENGERTRYFTLFASPGQDDPSKVLPDPAAELVLQRGQVQAGTATARRMIGELLERAGADEEQIDDVQLVVSELVGNVGLYAKEGGAEIRAWLLDDVLRVEVADTSRGLPTWRPESDVEQDDDTTPLTGVDRAAEEALLAAFTLDDLDAADSDPFALGERAAGTHGRGSGIIADLATARGVDLARDGGPGKTVWMEFEVSRSPVPEEATGNRHSKPLPAPEEDPRPTAQPRQPGQRPTESAVEGEATPADATRSSEVTADEPDRPGQPDAEPTLQRAKNGDPVALQALRDQFGRDTFRDILDKLGVPAAPVTRDAAPLVMLAREINGIVFGYAQAHRWPVPDGADVGHWLRGVAGEIVDRWRQLNSTQRKLILEGLNARQQGSEISVLQRGALNRLTPQAPAEQNDSTREPDVEEAGTAAATPDPEVAARLEAERRAAVAEVATDLGVGTDIVEMVLQGRSAVAEQAVARVREAAERLGYWNQVTKPDVARAAGVSLTTVDKVLGNARGGLDDHTRQLVLTVAAEIGYTGRITRAAVARAAGVGVSTVEKVLRDGPVLTSETANTVRDELRRRGLLAPTSEHGLRRAGQVVAEATAVEVAERAGVSPQKVYRVLRGEGGRDPETATRVLEEADAAGFRPQSVGAPDLRPVTRAALLRAVEHLPAAVAEYVTLRYLQETSPEDMRSALGHDADIDQLHRSALSYLGAFFAAELSENAVVYGTVREATVADAAWLAGTTTQMAARVLAGEEVTEESANRVTEAAGRIGLLGESAPGSGTNTATGLVFEQEPEPGVGLAGADVMQNQVARPRLADSPDRATLAQVAQAAGVDIATAHWVLLGGSGPNPDLVHQVLDAADGLDYSYSRQATEISDHADEQRVTVANVAQRASVTDAEVRRVLGGAITDPTIARRVWNAVSELLPETVGPRQTNIVAVPRAALERAIDRLPERLATYVKLRYLDALTPAQATADVGLTPQASQRIGQAAIRQLSHHLQDELDVSLPRHSALRRVRIEDVAQAVGVNRATVHRVLQGSEVLDPDVARRVWGAVGRLGFRQLRYASDPVPDEPDALTGLVFAPSRDIDLGRANIDDDTSKSANRPSGGAAGAIPDPEVPFYEDVDPRAALDLPPENRRFGRKAGPDLRVFHHNENDPLGRPYGHGVPPPPPAAGEPSATAPAAGSEDAALARSDEPAPGAPPRTGTPDSEWAAPESLDRDAPSAVQSADMLPFADHVDEPDDNPTGPGAVDSLLAPPSLEAPVPTTSAESTTIRDGAAPFGLLPRSAVAGLAARLHEAGGGATTSADTPFHRLPSDVRAAYVRDAEVALALVHEALRTGDDVRGDEFLERASGKMHDEWLRRNWRSATPEQRHAYAEPDFPEERRESHRAVVRTAVEFTHSDQATRSDSSAEASEIDPFARFTTGREIAAELRHRHGVDVVGFDLPDISIVVFREFARTIHELLTKYPHVQLHEVGIGSFSEGRLFATSDNVVGSDAMYPHTRSLIVSKQILTMPDLLSSTWKGMVNAGKATGPADQPVRGLLLREFAYALNATGRLEAEYNAKSALLEHCETSVGLGSPAQMFAWMDEQFRAYGRGEGGALESAKAIAGAFAAVEHDPTTATAGEKLLHELLTLAADKHAEEHRQRQILAAEYHPASPAEQQAKMAMITAVEAEHGIRFMGLDNPGIDLDTADQIVAAVLHMNAKFRVLGLSEIDIVPLDLEIIAQESTAGGVVFNESWVTAPVAARAEAVQQVATGRMRGDPDRWFYSVGIHEMAHRLRRVLPGAGSDAYSVLRKYRADTYGSTDHDDLIAWLREQISSYGFFRDGNLAVEEAEAEAVVAAEVSGLTPTEAERVLHTNLVTLAEAEVQRLDQAGARDEAPQPPAVANPGPRSPGTPAAPPPQGPVRPEDALDVHRPDKDRRRRTDPGMLDAYGDRVGPEAWAFKKPGRGAQPDRATVDRAKDERDAPRTDSSPRSPEPEKSDNARTNRPTPWQRNGGDEQHTGAPRERATDPRAGVAEFRTALRAVLAAGFVRYTPEQVLTDATVPQVVSAVGNLPSQQRQVLRLLWWEQSAEQIARELGLDVGAVLALGNEAANRIVRSLVIAAHVPQRFETLSKALSEANPWQLQDALRRLGRDQRRIVVGLCRHHNSSADLAKALGHSEDTLGLLAYGAVRRMAEFIADPATHRTSAPAGSRGGQDQSAARQRMATAFASEATGDDAADFVLRRLKDILPTPPTSANREDEGDRARENLDQPPRTAEGVTDRGIEVLELILAGESLEAIGSLWGMPTQTVKLELRRTSAALGTSGQIATVVEALRRGLLDLSRSTVPPWQRVRLSPKEREVIRLSAAGLSYPDIAARTGWSRSTVADQVSFASDKFRTDGLIPTVMAALRHGAVRIQDLDAPSTIEPASPPASRRPSKQTELSAREIEVLALAAQGLSNREIGAHLVIAPHTVESHLTRVGRKMGTSGRMSTVAAAQERGILATGQPASDQPVATRSSDNVPAEHKAAADAPSPTAVTVEISSPHKDLPGHQDRRKAVQPRGRDHQPGSSGNSPTTPSRGHGISDLEVQVLELTAEGLSRREIAEAAGVTQAKVKHSFERLRVALGIRGDRAEIVTAAKQRGIIGDPRSESRTPTTEVEPENANPHDDSQPRRATRHTGLIGHASVPSWDDIGGADAFSDGAPSNLGKPRQMRKRLRELSELHIDGGGWVPGRPFRLDPDEAAVAAIHDLPADRGDLNPDLTLEFLPFYEFDGLRTQEDLEAVATAVGDMMRERGWRDRSQTEAATELVRAAGRNAMTYMERYTRSLQRSGVEWWDEQTAVQNMKARLTLRMATQAESRSLYVSLDVDQYRPERFPDITMLRWHAPLFSDVEVGTEVRELLDSATVSGVEQWGEVWARFDEPRPEPSGESVIEPPPRGDLEAKARIVRKLYDDHHIRFLGWEDSVVRVQAVESVDRALRNLIAEYGSRFALREFMFDDETVGFGVTRSFGSTTPDTKDYYSSIRLNRKIFTDPDFAQSWADQVADHRWAESDEDMIYELTHHEFIHVVADEGNWVLHDLAPALLRAAYELFREHELIPADVGYTEWLALLPHYSLLPFSHPVTDTFDPIEGVAEGARAGAVVSSLPLTHPARVLHWLTVTRDGSSPAEFLARWAQRQDSGDSDISLLLQDFRDVSGRDDIAIPPRLRPEDTPIEILLAATGGQPQHFVDAGEIAARLRTWDQSSGSPGDGVSALVVSAGEAPYLLVRRVSPDGHTRVEVRNPIEGVLRAAHVPSTESPRPPGVQGIFFDETGAAITVPLAEAAGHDRAAPPTPAAESRHVNPQVDPAVAAGLAPERFRHPASRRKFGIIPPDSHLAFHRNPENGRSWDEHEPRPRDRPTSGHAETARPADDNPADTVTPGTTASALEPSPSIRRALETAESEADEILAEALYQARRLGVDTTTLHRKSPAEIEQAIEDLQDRQRRRFEAVLRRLVADDVLARVLADQEPARLLRRHYETLEPHIEAARKYVTEVRRALSILAARDVLVAEGATPFVDDDGKVVEGIGVAPGKRVVVASPFRDQRRLLDQQVPGFRELAAQRGIRIEYRHVRIDEHGRLTVEPISGIQTEPDPEIRLYRKRPYITWLNSLTDERSFAEKVQDAYDSGEVGRELLKGDSGDRTMSESVWLVTYRNGYQLIEKTVRDVLQADAEELGARTLSDVGARTPGLLRRAERVLLVEFLPGSDADSVMGMPSKDAWDHFFHTPSAMRLGLGDMLIRPWDRHEGKNWRLQYGFLVRPIDNSNAYQYNRLPGGFTLHYGARDDNGDMVWRQHHISRAELAVDRQRIEASEREYTRLGRRWWYRVVLYNFAQIEKNAEEDSARSRIEPAEAMELLEEIRDRLAAKLRLPGPYAARTQQEWRNAVEWLYMRTRGLDSTEYDTSAIREDLAALDKLVKLHLHQQLNEVSADELDDRWVSDDEAAATRPTLIDAYLDGLARRLADLEDETRYPDPNGESDAEWQARFEREIRDTTSSVTLPDTALGTAADSLRACIPYLVRLADALGHDNTRPVADDADTWIDLETGITAQLLEVAPRDIDADPTADELGPADPLRGIVDTVRDPDHPAEAAAIVVDNGEDAHAYLVTTIEGNVFVIDSLIPSPGIRPYERWSPSYRHVEKAFVGYFTRENGVLTPLHAPIPDHIDRPHPQRPIKGAPGTPDHRSAENRFARGIRSEPPGDDNRLSSTPDELSSSVRLALRSEPGMPAGGVHGVLRQLKQALTAAYMDLEGVGESDPAVEALSETPEEEFAAHFHQLRPVQQGALLLRYHQGRSETEVARMLNAVEEPVQPLGDVVARTLIFGAVRRLVRSIAAEQGMPDTDDRLTPNERRHLELVAQGLTATEISETVGCAPKTAMEVIEGIVRKFRSENKAAAVAEATRRGTLNILEFPVAANAAIALSAEDQAVLILIAKGHTGSSIARAMTESAGHTVSPGQVKGIMDRVGRAFGLRDRAGLVSVALREGILDVNGSEWLRWGSRTSTGIDLSEREATVLELLANGMTNPSIAAHLGLSVGAIGAYRQKLKRKLGVSTHEALLEAARRRGIEIVAPEEPGVPGFSEREIEVLGRLAMGTEYGEIATELGIAKGTVLTYVRRIRAKLALGPEADLLEAAQNIGIDLDVNVAAFNAEPPSDSTRDAQRNSDQTPESRLAPAQPGPPASAAEQRFIRWFRRRLADKSGQPRQSMAQYVKMHHLLSSQVNRWLARAGLDPTELASVPSGQFPRPDGDDSATWMSRVRAYLGLPHHQMDELIDAPWTWKPAEEGNRQLKITHVRALLRRVPGASEAYMDVARLYPALLTADGEPAYPEGYTHIGNYLEFCREYRNGEIEKFFEPSSDYVEYEIYTGAAVAHLTGLSPIYYSDIEKGRSRPSKFAARRLFAAIPPPHGVTGEELAERFEYLPRVTLIYPHPSVADSLGEYSRHFREVNHLTQEEVATIFDIQGADLSAYESATMRSRELRVLKVHDRVLHRAGPWNELAEAWGYRYRMDPAGETDPDPADYASVNDWLGAERLYRRMSPAEFDARVEIEGLTYYLNDRHRPLLTSLREIRDRLGIRRDRMRAAVLRFYQRHDIADQTTSDDELIWKHIEAPVGSPEEAAARDQLLEKYAWVADMMARRWRNAGEYEDLVQRGIEKILTAIRNATPGTNMYALSLANTRFAMRRAFAESRNPDADRKTGEMLRTVSAYINRHLDETDQEPDDADIAHATDLTVAQVTEARRLLTQRMHSLDEPIGDESGGSRHDLRAQSIFTAEDASSSGFYDVEFEDTLDSALSDLTEPDLTKQIVLHLMEDQTLDEVAASLGITIEHAGRLLGEARDSLRTAFGRPHEKDGANGASPRIPLPPTDPHAGDRPQPREAAKPQVHPYRRTAELSTDPKQQSSRSRGHAEVAEPVDDAESVSEPSAAESGRQRSATVDGEADSGRGPAATDGTAAAIRRPAATRRIGLIGGVPDLIDPFDDRGDPWDRGGPVPRHQRINRLVEPHADGGGFVRGRKQEDPASPAVSEARGTVPNEAADNGVDGSEYWAEVDAAIEQVVAINPAFEYLRKMPKPAEGAPFGAAWVSNRREWFHALFHEDTETLRNIELTEKDLLELARLIKRAPLYMTLMLVNVTGSSIDQLVHDHKVDWRNLFFTQEKITRDGETIPVWKIRTLQVDTPEKASDRNVVNEITPWARLQRTTSMDELPQLALIAAGVMQYFSGRPMLNPDIELMDDARRRGVITEEQYAFWIAYPKDDLWSAAFFPGCRRLEAQGDDYLKARVLCAFIWSRMGSRAAEEYLMEVIDRYLFSTVLREGAEFVLGTGTEIVESITGLLPGQAGQKLLETGQQVFGGVTGRIGNTIRGLAGRAADLVYPAPEDRPGAPGNDNPASEGQSTERDTETRTPDVGINRDAADGEVDLDEPLYVAHVPDDLDGPLYVVAPEEEEAMRGTDEPIYIVSLDAIPSVYPPLRDLLPVEEYRHLGGDQGVVLPRATAVALRDAAVEHGERMSGSYNNIYLLGDFAIRVRKQGPAQLDFVLWPKEYQTLHALAQAGVQGVPQVLHVELDNQGDVLFQIQRRIYGAPVSNLHSPQVSAALVAMSRQLDEVPVPQELLPLPAWYPESGDSAGFFRMLMEHTEQIYQRYRSVERYRTIFGRLGLGESLSTALEPELQYVRPQQFLVIHGDLTSANVLEVSSGHAIVDFELALYGPKDYEAAVLTHRSPGSTRSLDPYTVHLEPWLHLLDMHRVIVDTVRLVEAANSPDPGHFRLFELSWNVTKSLARASQHSPGREVLSVDEILRLVVALRLEAAIDREEDLYVVATPDEPPPPDTSDARSSD
ncbi:LuxR C-terminal-related transcriptional regulator [Nocardia asiatica]|uniref:LuxR C-terminal-related transcriptional regulator n=1 Tax=Nocardia asiatica TaxID=209252 RepID=UPI003EE15590